MTRINTQKAIKNSWTKALLLWSLPVLFVLLISENSWAQNAVAYGESFPIDYTYKYLKNGNEKEKDFNGIVQVSVQYGKAGGKFGFIQPGETIDFSEVEDKTLQVQIHQFTLSPKPKKNLGKFALFINTKDAVVGYGIEQLSLTKHVLDKYYDRNLYPEMPANNLRVEFEVKKNGKVDLLIPMGIVSDNDPFEQWRFDHIDVRIQFNVTGFEIKEEIVVGPPMPEESPDLKFWKLHQGNINGWVTYLQSYPTGTYAQEALQQIKEQDEANWRIAQSEESLASYQTYLSRAQVYAQYASHREAAEREVDRRKDLSEQQKKERQVWKNAEKEHTRSSYLGYLEAYPEGRYAQNAKVNLQLLIPMKLYKEDLADGKSKIIIENASNPRYKDVSLDFGLKIDDRRLRSDSILMVTYLAGGRYKIIVEDEFGKKDSLSFDNELEVSMAINRRDSSKMIFNIKKGIKPYKIDLIHSLSNNLAWSLDSIQSESIEIGMEQWQAAQLGGDYKVEVWDSKSWKPVLVAQKISVPEMPRQWDTPFIIAGVLGLLVFMAGIFFLIKLFLDRRNQKQHYQLQ